jgi:seryl-tRNA synthetase
MIQDMLDINFIRDNLDIVKEAARKKNVTINLDELIKLDEERRQKQQLVDSLREEQNIVSKNVATADTPEIRQQLIMEMRGLKENLQKHEDELKKILSAWKLLMLQVPNVPDLSVPEGKSDADNQPIRNWGEKPTFDFPIKDHVELMTALAMVDFERGTKVHGFRGYFLTGAGADLSWALWNYAREFFGERSFVSMMVPNIVRQQHFYGTGHLPNDAEDIFKTQDDDYLIGTSEVSAMAFHADEVLSHQELPKKYLGFSPCFRREAGSYGKDTKGLYRVHEFYKLEQIILCEASHETSVQFHEEITKSAEDFIQSLGLPYQVVLNCGGDLGLGQVKKYDIEVWTPSVATYRESHSASYFHDFQTRRFNIKYRDSEGKMRFAHSLNNTAIATPRILIALVENFQQADGSILIPQVLQKYMGKDRISL